MDKMGTEHILTVTIHNTHNVNLMEIMTDMEMETVCVNRPLVLLICIRGRVSCLNLSSRLVAVRKSLLLHITDLW